MKKYTFIMMPGEVELTQIAASEKVAHKKAWDSLTDEQKNACAYLEFVDEAIVPRQDRFKDISLAAFKHAYYATSGETRGESFQEAYDEKFAELIIEKCAYVARQCYTVRGVDAEDVAQHIEATFKNKEAIHA